MAQRRPERAPRLYRSGAHVDVAALLLVADALGVVDGGRDAAPGEQFDERGGVRGDRLSGEDRYQRGGVRVGRAPEPLRVVAADPCGQTVGPAELVGGP